MRRTVVGDLRIIVNVNYFVVFGAAQNRKFAVRVLEIKFRGRVVARGVVQRERLDFAFANTYIRLLAVEGHLVGVAHFHKLVKVKIFVYVSRFKRFAVIELEHVGGL